jgi:hypothetical protein
MKASQFLKNKLRVKIFEYKCGEITRSPSNDAIMEAMIRLTCSSGGEIIYIKYFAGKASWKMTSSMSCKEIRWSF